MDLERQYEKLLRYCYMKTKNKELAEDIVQDTYLKFWQNKSYRDIGKEEAYLYTIARNLCMDAFRRPVCENIDEQPDLSDEHAQDAQQVIERIAIDAALDRLADDLREIVVLRYINDLAIKDVAKIVGISRFSVRRRLQEGLKILRDYLQEGE